MPPEPLPVSLIDDGITEPALHYALEEALARAVDARTCGPVLRLRRLDACALVGIHQDPAEDLDLPACRAEGIPVLRRHNPGGAVYQDEGTFCFSLFADRATLLEHVAGAPPRTPPEGRGPSGPPDSLSPEILYPAVARAVVAACASLGVAAAGSPVNDVTVSGRKIYGSAQVSFGSALVHSGTFLVSANLDRMAQLLKPSDLKFVDKGFKSVRERVVNLSECAGRPIDRERFMGEFAGRLAGELSLSLKPATLPDAIRREAETLRDTKYGRREWTFRTAPRRSTSLAAKAESGVVTLAADLEGGRIIAADCRGDFLLHDSAPLQAALAATRDLTPHEAAGRIAAAPLPPDLSGTLARLFRELADKEDPR